jgi:hypothetical protein
VKAHQSDFQSQLQAKECKAKKLYLSDEFTSMKEKGQRDIANFIINQFDAVGGGIIMNGSSKPKAKDIIF